MAQLFYIIGIISAGKVEIKQSAHKHSGENWIKEQRIIVNREFVAFGKRSGHRVSAKRLSSKMMSRRYLRWLRYLP